MTSRRAFVAGTVAAAAEVSRSLPTRAAQPYDFAAIETRFARPARHRQAFAVARIADGAPLGQMWHALDVYEKTMREGPGSLHIAAIFYSRGVVLGLDDSAWRAYGLGGAARRRGDSVTATGEGNPFTSEIAALLGRNVSAFVCDNALDEWATYLVLVQGVGGRSVEEVRDDLRRRIAPGALLVPAGVVALNQAQEARFTYVQASL